LARASKIPICWRTADTYNLRDILEGKDHAFALSYLENSLVVQGRLKESEASDMMKDIYSPEFYAGQTTGSRIAAREVLGRLKRVFPFSSVVDIGCGIGSWLAEAKAIGVERTVGVDGAHVPAALRLIPDDEFVEADLESPVSLNETFDVCICVEVAEHLSPSRSTSLVDDLARLSEVIVFSAAIPYQGGDGHINEMWSEFWASLFASKGYLPSTTLRSEIWSLAEIPWWYRQNLLLFYSPQHADRFSDGFDSAGTTLTRIHPESYIGNSRCAGTNIVSSYEEDVAVYRECIARHEVAVPGASRRRG
jgi:SAM-dependent methyltransferase